MIRIQEQGNKCQVTGTSEKEFKDVLDQILVQIRDKEKDVLVLYQKEEEGYNTKSTSSTSVLIPSGIINWFLSELDYRDIKYDFKSLPRLPIQTIPNTLLDDGPEPIILRDYQVASIRKGVSHRRGIFNIATGGGKTEIIIGIAKVIGNSLTIVSSKSSLKQTYARFKKRGLNDVGRLGGGFNDASCSHTIATASVINSRLKAKNKDVEKLLKRVDLLMFDEVHHLGTAPSWQRVARECTASQRFGFSGSPWATGLPCIDLGNDKESKYADFRVASEVGDILVYIPSIMLREMGVIVDPSLYIIAINEPKGLTRNPFPRWRWVYKHGIIENEHRNNLITEAASKLHSKKHRTAILVVSIAHGTELLKRLHSLGLSAAFTKGDDEVLVYTGKKVKKLKDAGEQYREAFLTGDLDVLVGSVVIDESVDLPNMTALILAGGMKSPIRAVQRIGRAIRTAKGKEEAIVIDFRDRQHFFLNNHTNKRLGIYAAHEYHYEEVDWEQLWERV